MTWHGQFDDVEFLSGLFDLQPLPSTDSRFKDAAGDIWQHRYSNAPPSSNAAGKHRRVTTRNSRARIFSERAAASTATQL
ncbi:AbiJ-related protein [Pseudomonas viridiflava]|uniref:AbiJ-related protein n=1 Tax=Pseudomonas viridiflava TaxID=33069 RepID=UPI001F119E46|nr:hypothetical protein [Pseudomonas viridiflava]